MDLKRTGLYTATGNVGVYRVSEETRRKVERDSRAIAMNIKKQNNLAREKHKQEEHNRHLLYEHERENMIDRWKHRYKHSPYKAMNFTQELDRMDAVEQAETRRRIDTQKLRVIQNMTGRYNDPYVTPVTVKTLPLESQLALRYRQHVMDESKVAMEASELERLAAEEFRAIEKKFPKLRTVQSVSSSNMSLSSSSSLASGPVIQRRPASRSRPEDCSSQNSGPSVRRLLSRKGPKLGMNYDLPASESMSFEGPLEYTSPAEQMRQIQDDISLEFALIEEGQGTK